METQKLTRLDLTYIATVGIAMLVALLKHEKSNGIFLVFGMTTALVFLCLVTSRLPISSPRAKKYFFSLLGIFMLEQLLQTWL